MIYCRVSYFEITSKDNGLLTRSLARYPRMRQCHNNLPLQVWDRGQREEEEGRPIDTCLCLHKV